MSTRNVEENLAAHLAIRGLLDRYTNAVNQRDWAEVEAVFSKDGVWDASEGDMAFRFEGATHCAKGIAEIVNQTDVAIQSNHAIVIEVDGDRARATSTINGHVVMKGAAAVMTVWGTFYDVIARDADGEWRFKQRTFRMTWRDTSAPKGEILTTFPLEKRPG